MLASYGIRCGVFVLAVLIAAPLATTGTPSAQETAPAETGPPDDVIREAQNLLRALGYATGPADAAIWSDSLARAYRAFLSDAGLPSSKTLTPRGLRGLREVARSEGLAAGIDAPVDNAAQVSASGRLDRLHRAVVAGDIDGVQALIAGGASVDGRDGQGWTALMHAANKGYVVLVELLLQEGASPDIRAPDGATALFIAVMNGHPESIALLMRAGASVSIRGPRGLTAAEAARLIYGDDEGQRPVPDFAEVHALLEGMTWEDAVKTAVADHQAERDVAAIEASLQLDREARVQVQRRLSALGFSPGPADGVFGRRTRLAIISWQEREGFSGTGYLTPEQAETLAAGDEEDRAEQERIAREQAEREAREKAEREEAEREREFWDSVKGSDDPSDFEAYLEAYPGGAYVVLARQRRDAWMFADDVGYARAEATGTEEAYEKYLSAFPSGRHVAEARRQLAEVSKPKWEAGQKFRDCSECPEMVVVPAGSFTMGSPPDKTFRRDNEGPQHLVTISAPFAVSRYEVTRQEYAKFIDDTGYSSRNDSCWILKDRWQEMAEWEQTQGLGWQDPGYQQGKREPVVCVSWDDAKAYVNWLSRTTGKRYRLLSEAEWEYAAREEPGYMCEYGNGFDQTAESQLDIWTTNYAIACRDGAAHTSTVGNYKENGFGLSDMVGNVFEWVEDCWHDNYVGAPVDGSAWVSAADCNVRVVRSSSWARGLDMFHTTYRSFSSSQFSVWTFGIRVAQTLIP